MIRLGLGALIALGCALVARPALAGSGPYAAACLTTPVLAETFGDGAVPTRWTVIAHPARANPSGERQAYRDDAVVTGPQGLQLIARRQAAGYVSGRIASKALFRYGCFDIVARMPAGRGLWPALWLRTPYDRPIDGEIDIMEGFGSHPGVLQGTLHQWTRGVHHGFACMRIGDLRASVFAMAGACGWQPRWWADSFTTAPHHYGLIWTPRAVTWLIDGAAYFTCRDGIPDRAMAIQLDLAVGGIFDGEPGPDTGFPAHMAVGAVTVWPLKP